MKPYCCRTSLFWYYSVLELRVALLSSSRNCLRGQSLKANLHTFWFQQLTKTTKFEYTHKLLGQNTGISFKSWAIGGYELDTKAKWSLLDLSAAEQRQVITKLALPSCYNFKFCIHTSRVYPVVVLTISFTLILPVRCAS